MTETFNVKDIQGYLEIRKKPKGSDKWHTELVKNVVVTNAREIVRDLVFGKRQNGVDGKDQPVWETAPSITALGLGDMGLTLEQAQTSVPEASINDKVLVNPTYWCPVHDEQYPNNLVEPVDYKGKKAVRYVFVIGQDQGNTSSGFFCELGLCIDTSKYPDAYLFTKLNKMPPISKTEGDEITITYYLLF